MTNAAKNKNLRYIDRSIASETAELEQAQKNGEGWRVLACQNALRDLRLRRELMAAR